MKGIYKTICVGIVGLPLLFGGCSKPTEYITIKGTVIDETYIPREVVSVTGTTIDSKYSFSMKTKQGKKVVQVEDTFDKDKETIDTLVNRDANVEFKLPKSIADDQVYVVKADRINVL